MRTYRVIVTTICVSLVAYSWSAEAAKKTGMGGYLSDTSKPVTVKLPGGSSLELTHGKSMEVPELGGSIVLLVVAHGRKIGMDTQGLLQMRRPWGRGLFFNYLPS